VITGQIHQIAFVRKIAENRIFRFLLTSRIMKCNRLNRLIAVVSVVFSLTATSPASAASGTWFSITGGDWNDATTAPWTSGTVAGGATFTGSFTSDILADATINLTASRTIGNITFNDTGASGDSRWILAASGGSVLTLDNGTSDAVITKTSVATISAQLASSGTVSIVGGGDLTISGNNTGLTGTVRLGGTNQIFITNNNALGSAALIVNGQPALSAVTNDVTLTNSIGFNASGDSLIWTGNGGRALNLNGTMTLNASNTSAQGFRMWLSDVTQSGAVSLGARNLSIQGDNRQLTISGKISGTGGIVKSHSGILLLSGTDANDFSGGITFNAGSIRVANNNAALGTGTLTVTTTTTNGSTTNLLATASGGGARTLSNNVVITNNGSGITTLQLDGGFADLNLAGGISGNGRVQTTSSGTIRLTGTNSYTGSTELTGTNTLILSGTNTTSGITLGSGNTLALRNISLAANITGAGRVQKDGAFFGTSVLTGNNNNYTGTTTVNIDWFRVASTGVINGTSSITVQGQWSARYDNLGSTTTPGAVTVNGYAGSGSDTDSGIFYNGNVAGTTPGTLTAASITLDSSFRSSATVRAKGGVFFNYANSTVNLGAGAITVNGQGNSLAGSMTAAGSTFTNAGTVTAGSITLNSSSTANTASNKGGTYSQTAGNTTLSGSLTLATNGGTGSAGTAGNDAAFNLSGGTFSANSIAVNSGTLTATGGTITLGSGGITKTGSAVTAVNLGATTLAASTAWNSSLSMALTNASTGTTINTTGGNIGLSGELSGSGNLVKSGTGTLILSGNHSYTGTTNVTTGVFAVNGSLATNSTTIQSSATLQGSGAINGTITVSGTLSPGNSIESLGSGAATFNSSSTFDYEFNTSSGTADLLYSSGALSIANGTTLLLSDLGLNAELSYGTKFTLISYFSTAENWTGGLFTYDSQMLNNGDIFTLGANQWLFDYNDLTGGANFASDQSGASRFVTMTAIPEPSTLLLGGFSILALLRRNRQKAQHS
jgi:fibronectin-binding autotransporter adhesin